MCQEDTCIKAHISWLLWYCGISELIRMPFRHWLHSCSDLFVFSFLKLSHLPKMLLLIMPEFFIGIYAENESLTLGGILQRAAVKVPVVDMQCLYSIVHQAELLVHV